MGQMFGSSMTIRRAPAIRAALTSSASEDSRAFANTMTSGGRCTRPWPEEPSGAVESVPMIDSHVPAHSRAVA